MPTNGRPEIRWMFSYFRIIKANINKIIDDGKNGRSHREINTPGESKGSSEKPFRLLYDKVKSGERKIAKSACRCKVKKRAKAGKSPIPPNRSFSRQIGKEAAFCRIG
jgi:hypothetical protein